jgi:hypothetical protein
MRKINKRAELSITPMKGLLTQVLADLIIGFTQI